MNSEEYAEFRQDVANYINAGGTIKVYGPGTGIRADGVAYGDGPKAQLLYEKTDGSLPWTTDGE